MHYQHPWMGLTMELDVQEQFGWTANPQNNIVSTMLGILGGQIAAHGMLDIVFQRRQSKILSLLRKTQSPSKKYPTISHSYSFILNLVFNRTSYYVKTINISQIDRRYWIKTSCIWANDGFLTIKFKLWKKYRTASKKSIRIILYSGQFFRDRIPHGPTSVPKMSWDQGLQNSRKKKA